MLDAARDALARYAGVARRFQFRGEAGGVTVVDDYAHNPGKVAAVLAAARAGGWGRVVVVFQPQRYTRTATLWREFGPAFGDADVVVLTEVYAANELPMPGVTGKLLVDSTLEAHPWKRVAWLPGQRRRRRLAGAASCDPATCASPPAPATSPRGPTTSSPPSAPGEVLMGRAGASPLEACERAAAATPSAIGSGATSPLGPRTTYRVGGAAALLRRGDDGRRPRAPPATRSSPPASPCSSWARARTCSSPTPASPVWPSPWATPSPTIDRRRARPCTAGGAAALPVVARRTVAAGLTGFEWAVGVPGSIGGAVRMNAGGHGADMAASLVGIRVLDLAGGEDGVVPAARLDLGYRRSNLAATAVVVDATLALAGGDRAAGEATLAEIVRWRRENQPGGPNAGSVFTNPPGDSAGRLVDAAGAKGLRIGSAEVSTKHANFIQADAGGSAADVLALMREVRRRVAERFGVDLHPETVLVGFDNPQVEVEG